MTFLSSAPTMGQIPLSGLSMLFTDSQGMVVFADRNFARLAHHMHERFDLRGPLHKVLGIGKDYADDMLANVKANGLFTGRTVEAHTRSGELLPMWSTSVATYDDQSEFIGADLIISNTISGPHANILLTNHIDVLTVHVQQTMAESRSVHHQTYIQAYMGAQFTVLQVLLARMAGPLLRDVLEAQLVRQCETANWPLAVREGELTFTRTNAPFQVYGEFQKMAVSYAASVVGRKVVTKELAILDSQLDPGTLELVTDLGLRLQ